MKKQNTLNKISPETRKRIINIAAQLPSIPFFMDGKDGMVPQMITTGYRVEGRQLSTKEIEHLGDSYNPSSIYTRKHKSVRLMNHKVTLTTQYQKMGEAGINDYVVYVKQMDIMIKNMEAGKLNKDQEKEFVIMNGQPLGQHDQKIHDIITNQEEGPDMSALNIGEDGF